eukprot:102074-Rhodomonas_salina.1
MALYSRARALQSCTLPFMYLTPDGFEHDRQSCSGPVCDLNMLLTPNAVCCAEQQVLAGRTLQLAETMRAWILDDGWGPRQTPGSKGRAVSFQIRGE